MGVINDRLTFLILRATFKNQQFRIFRVGRTCDLPTLAMRPTGRSRSTGTPALNGHNFPSAVTSWLRHAGVSGDVIDLAA